MGWECVGGAAPGCVGAGPVYEGAGHVGWVHGDVVPASPDDAVQGMGRVLDARQPLEVLRGDPQLAACDGVAASGDRGNVDDEPLGDALSVPASGYDEGTLRGAMLLAGDVGEVGAHLGSHGDQGGLDVERLASLGDSRVGGGLDAQGPASQGEDLHEGRGQGRDQPRGGPLDACPGGEGCPSLGALDEQGVPLGAVDARRPLDAPSLDAPLDDDQEAGDVTV